MSVEHAVVLAAGRGARLAAEAGSLPKPLVPVGARPAIAHILDGLRDAGFTRIVIVTGYRAGTLEAELGNGAAAGIQLEYARQENLDGPARALWHARELLGTDQFLFTCGDVLVPWENYRRVLSAARFAAGAIAVDRTDFPGRGTIAVDASDGNGPVTAASVAPGELRTSWYCAGFGVLPPETWPAIETMPPAPTGEYELEPVIDVLAREGQAIRAVPVDGPCIDISTSRTLARARETFGGRR
ncbi:MAG: NTP transferase domain-containing protein [Dehalococcoidia bacterium]|nr:NTP transferase domain-containing protein [Dehalococcoidia bacterium]